MLADLLHQARDDAAAVLEHRGEIAGATIHVLSLAAVAARHTLAYGPLDQVTRPVLVARYAEHAIDALRHVAQRPASLLDVQAVTGDVRSGTPVERLEVGLDHWVRATRREVDQMIPSVDVIRQIANQGAHLCAVTRALITNKAADIEGLALPEDAALLRTAEALRSGERAWQNLTTLTRPSHEFVTASRNLYEALHAIGTALQKQNPDLDTARAAEILRRGLAHISDLATATRGLPETFLNAGVLFAPATALPAKEELVTARLRRQHVPVNYTDVPNLLRDWADASAAANTVLICIRTSPEAAKGVPSVEGRTTQCEAHVTLQMRATTSHWTRRGRGARHLGGGHP